MKMTYIGARDLPEAWFLCLKGCMESGYEYTIDCGSHQGSKRKEFDSVTILVKYPGSRPLVPTVPEGVPSPSSMEYVESYLPYLMTSHKEPNEQYTYGEDLDSQLPKLIEMYKQDGFGTDQACMTVGSKSSILLSDPPCLRVIDTRIRYGKLYFYVYFRSWDLWGGFPSNLAAIQIIKEYVAGEVGVEDGELVAYSKGLHLYQHHWELARVVLRG